MIALVSVGVIQCSDDIIFEALIVCISLIYYSNRKRQGN